jgi:hypothetical protein
METLNVHTTTRLHAGKLFWTGRIISYLCIAFLLFDGIMKIILHPLHIEGSANLGWAVSAVRPIGIVLSICTVLYIIPRTAIIGAMFLTAYLGGAVATMARLGEPYFFAVIFAVLIWASLYLRDERLRIILR